MKWLYRRDFPTAKTLYSECEKWYKLGYRVFIHGHSSMDCEEYRNNFKGTLSCMLQE